MRTHPFLASMLVLFGCGAHQAVDVTRSETTSFLVDLGSDDAGAVLAGPGIEPGQLYATIGEGPSGLVRVVDREPADCDHCMRPRFAADVVRAAEHPLVALGPLPGPLENARAASLAFHPTNAWSVVFTVDLDGDGATDIEGVTRCGHETPSGCDAQVCDSYCHATRSAGSVEVRGERCQGFIPDTDDCLPSESKR